MSNTEVLSIERRPGEAAIPRVPDWKMLTRSGTPTLLRRFTCRGLPEAVWLVMKIGELAEHGGQGPTLVVEPDSVTVALSTRSEGGVHRDVFAFAAEIDRMYAGH